MNDLGCAVKTCAYNKKNCCEREEILIAGENASDSEATSCSSFRDKEGNEKISKCECNNEKPTEIHCEATHCTYNDHKECKAEHVDVTGSQAIISSETECATFIPAR